MNFPTWSSVQFLIDESTPKTCPRASSPLQRQSSQRLVDRVSPGFRCGGGRTASRRPHHSPWPARGHALTSQSVVTEASAQVQRAKQGVAIGVRHEHPQRSGPSVDRTTALPSLLPADGDGTHHTLLLRCRRGWQAGVLPRARTKASAVFEFEEQGIRAHFRQALTGGTQHKAATTLTGYVSPHCSYLFRPGGSKQLGVDSSPWAASSVPSGIGRASGTSPPCFPSSWPS